LGGAFAAASSRRQGTVVALFRAPAADAPMEALTEARLLAGVGLEGDRYALGLGRFASVGRAGQALTLIEAEALEALRSEHGLELAQGASRRNVVTRGIDLNAMRGLRFRLGEVECLGQRLADPCSWLQRTTPPGTLRALVSRGGLRADLVTGGVVRVGDVIEVLDEKPASR
jgi:MOSC domain-containing protein YiiM